MRTGYTSFISASSDSTPEIMCGNYRAPSIRHKTMLVALLFSAHISASARGLSGLHVVSLGSSYTANIYCPPNDNSESWMSIRVSPRSKNRHSGLGREHIFKTGFGYPTSYEAVRLKGSKVYCLVSWVSTRVNGFSDVWLFDCRSSRLNQVGIDLFNVNTDELRNRRLVETAGSQYVTGHGGSMITRTISLDPDKLSANFGRWKPVRRT